MATVVISPGTSFPSAVASLNAGDTLQCRQGVYDHGTSSLSQVTQDNITVESYPGERATIRGTRRWNWIGDNQTIQRMNWWTTGALGLEGASWKFYYNDRTNFFSPEGNYPSYDHFGIANMANGSGGHAKGNFFHQIGVLDADTKAQTPAYDHQSTPHSHSWYMQSNNGVYEDERHYEVLGGYAYHMYDGGGPVTGNTITRCLSSNGYFMVCAGQSVRNGTFTQCASSWLHGTENRPPYRAGPTPIPSKEPCGRVSGSGTGLMQNCATWSNVPTGLGGQDGIGESSQLTQSGNIVAEAQFRNPRAGDFTIDNATVRTKVGFGGISTAGLQIPLGGVRPTKPLPPTCTYGTDASGPFVNVTWSPVSGATSYKVYSEIYGTPGVTVVTAATPYKIRPVTPGKTYLVRITAVNANGESDPSNYGSVATPALPPPQPTAPSNVTITPTRVEPYSILVVSWTASSPTSVIYFVFLNGDPVATFVNRSPFITIDAAAGVDYYATVKAVSVVNGVHSPMSAPSPTVRAL